MDKEITTYKWTGDQWRVIERRMVPAGGIKAPRWRPCWWHNGREEIQSLQAPIGWTKGRLPGSHRKKNTVD